MLRYESKHVATFVNNNTFVVFWLENILSNLVKHIGMAPIKIYWFCFSSPQFQNSDWPKSFSQSLRLQPEQNSVIIKKGGIGISKIEGKNSVYYKVKKEQGGYHLSNIRTENIKIYRLFLAFYRIQFV
jgi:hypothetical protein